MKRVPADATQLLIDVRKGAPSATAALLEVVYEELHRLASAHMRRQRPNHTLQPTALVHEVFVQLVDRDQIDWADRSHFMAVAATAMRQILIKHARGKNAAKRGGGLERLTLDQAASPTGARPLQVIALDDALTRLATLSARQCRVVELRFFGGLTIAEVAHVLGVGTTTVEDDWHAARVWLAIELGGAEA